jgi:predicted RecA/RadA family phage recombinase
MRHEGNRIKYYNATSTAIASGAWVSLSSLRVGRAVAAIPALSWGTLEVKGAHEVTAAAGAWTVGQAIYYDAGNTNFTTEASGTVPAGWATQTKASAATTGYIMLNE